MTNSSDESLTKVRLRFRVLDGEMRVLSDRMVTILEAVDAAEEQAAKAREVLARGEAVTLLVTDPDDGDEVVWRALWEPHTRDPERGLKTEE